MSATNHTSHYSLPQFISSDIPTWLGDINSAFLTTDTQIFNASEAAGTAQADATTAKTASTQNAADIVILQTADTSLQQKITTETTDRKSADTTLQANIDTANSSIATANSNISANTQSIATLQTLTIRDFVSLTVATSAWVADTTFTNFPYKAPIAISTATVNDVPDVQPSQDALDLGILGGKATTAAGYVYIYASEIPSADMTIDRITLRKENA